MTVGDIQARHLCELLGDSVDIALVADNPELVTETVDRRDEIVDRFCLGISVEDVVENAVVGVSEEHRLHVGISGEDMFHTVVFLITTGELMALDDTVAVVGNVSSENDAILCLPVHGLSIDIIVLILVLNEPSFLLELLELALCLVIDARIILACSGSKFISGLII